MKQAHRRTILKVIALLLAWGAAGAALNVAVAWGLALLGQRTVAPADRRADYEETKWMQSHGEHPAVMFFGNRHFNGICSESRSWLLKDAAYEAAMSFKLDTTGGSAPPPPFRATRLRAGWPQRSMEGYDIWHTSGYALQYPGRTQIESTWHLGRKIMPTLPLWPGFAINTVFYAGVLWMLWATPFALRQMIRRRRGQCAHCAYPFGTSEVCTECGAAVTPRPRAVAQITA